MPEAPRRFEKLFVRPTDSPMERLQRTYTVVGMLGVLLAMLGFAVVDGLRGAGGESQRSLWVVMVVVLGLISATRWPRPTDFPRLMMAFLLALIAYEGFIGANEGYSFLWCFVFPPGLFFLLGRREGTVWFAVTATLLTWLLFGAERPAAMTEVVCFLALASFFLLGILCHGLEVARSQLIDTLVRETHKLQNALADLEVLNGMVRICAACKRTRDDQGFWSRIETYLAHHSAVELEAALCPDCADEVGSSRLDLQKPAASTPHALSFLQHPSEEPSRRHYLDFGMVLLIPFLIYFGWIDIRAERFSEATLVLGLALTLVAALIGLRRWPQRESQICHVATGAGFAVLTFQIYTGAYDGFMALWFYLFPGYAIFLLGTYGALWSTAAFGAAAFFLFTPVGFDYPEAFAVRLLVTSSLVILLTYLIEVSRRRASRRLESEQSALHKALSEVQTLRGMLPMCPLCKNVRDDQGFWECVETHVTKVSGTQFSHGLCPECGEKILAELEAEGALAS